MALQPQTPLAKKLHAYVDLTPSDLSFISAIDERKRSVPMGQTLLREGHAHDMAYLVADGWLCAYKTLRNGSRQIVDFHLPGDFAGLRSLLLRTADHGVDSITDVAVSTVTLSSLMERFEDSPGFAMALLRAVSRDEATVVEHLVSLGRRSALERTAHLFLELGARLTLVNRGTMQSYACPLSQFLLADALGLSAIHVNRVLRELREGKLMTFRNGRVTIHDLAGLVDLAGYEGEYLDIGLPTLN